MTKDDFRNYLASDNTNVTENYREDWIKLMKKIVSELTGITGNDPFPAIISLKPLEQLIESAPDGFSIKMRDEEARIRKAITDILAAR